MLILQYEVKADICVEKDFVQSIISCFLMTLESMASVHFAQFLTWTTPGYSYFIYLRLTCQNYPLATFYLYSRADQESYKDRQYKNKQQRLCDKQWSIQRNNLLHNKDH